MIRDKTVLMMSRNDDQEVPAVQVSENELSWSENSWVQVVRIREVSEFELSVFEILHFEFPSRIVIESSSCSASRVCIEWFELSCLKISGLKSSSSYRSSSSRLRTFQCLSFQLVRHPEICYWWDAHSADILKLRIFFILNFSSQTRGLDSGVSLYNPQLQSSQFLTWHNSTSHLEPAFVCAKLFHRKAAGQLLTCAVVLVYFL